MAGEERRIL